MCSTFVTRRVTNVVRSKAVDAANRLIGAPKLGRNSTIERAQQRGAFDRRAAGGHRRNGEVVCLSLWFVSACGSDNRIEPADPLGTMIQSLFSSSTTGSTTWPSRARWEPRAPSAARTGMCTSSKPRRVEPGANVAGKVSVRP